MAGTLRWIIGSVVVLILGLAYASVTGIYEAVTAGRVNRKADRPSNPEAIEVNSGEGLRPVEVMSSTEGRVRDEAVSIASVHEENADEAAADKAAADKAAADKKLVMDKAAADKAAAEKAAAEKAAAEKAAADKAAADKAAAEKAAADWTKAATKKAAADGLKQPTATKPMDKLPAETNPADGVGAVPSEGWVELTSKPSAKILVNGNNTGLSTPVSGRSLALPAGRHRITFHVDGNKYTFTVVVKAGETVTLNKELQ